MKKTLLINMLWLSAFPLAAQSYMEKAETFSRDTLNDLVLNDYPSIEWMGEDSRYFSYQVETPENRTFYLVDTKNWKKTQFFDRKEIKPYVDSLRGWGAKIGETVRKPLSHTGGTGMGTGQNAGRKTASISHVPSATTSIFSRQSQTVPEIFSRKRNRQTASVSAMTGHSGPPIRQGAIPRIRPKLKAGAGQ